MSQLLQVGWQRAGHEMAYYREQQQEDGGDRPRMYIMSFLIQFPHSQVVPSCPKLYIISVVLSHPALTGHRLPRALLSLSLLRHDA